jgi:hypothetical protein
LVPSNNVYIVHLYIKLHFSLALVIRRVHLRRKDTLRKRLKESLAGHVTTRHSTLWTVAATAGSQNVTRVYQFRFLPRTWCECRCRNSRRSTLIRGRGRSDMCRVSLSVVPRLGYYHCHVPSTPRSRVQKNSPSAEPWSPEHGSRHVCLCMMCYRFERPFGNG